MKTREVRTKEFIPYLKGYTTATDIIVSDNGKNYAINNSNNEIEIHNLETGKLVKKFSALPTLPKIEGFQLVPLPQEGDYIYWLLFNNKYATGGLAYLVRNGVATSFCDPLWDQESDANYAKNLKELLENYNEVEKRKLEKEKYEQQKNANAPSLGDILISQSKERKKVLAEKNSNNNVQNTTSSAPSSGKNYTQPAKSYNEIVYDLRKVQQERNEKSAREARMEEYRKRP
ncbi:hypothetical protein [Halpernia sp.]|uniref:hypothetical protein n=1 Tax=Halpernia sp. TaxID=2782209 RepID=UPI003A93DCF0